MNEREKGMPFPEAKKRARAGLIRSAMLWTPFAVVCIGAWLFYTFDRIFLDGDNGSTWFLVVVLTVFSVLFGFQAIQPLLDLFGDTKEMTGRITRRWARSDSLVIRTHYIRIGRKHIFRIDRAVHGDVREGDYVSVRYYPHSATVITIGKTDEPDEPEKHPLQQALEDADSERQKRRKEPPARPEF